MQEIINIKIPYPKIQTGKKKNQLVTLNNWGSIHWTEKSRIKNSLKSILRNWFLEKAEKQYEMLELEFTVLTKNNRSVDAINPAPIYKVIEDVVAELGYIENDKANKIILNPSQKHNLNETQIKIEIRGK